MILGTHAKTEVRRTTIVSTTPKYKFATFLCGSIPYAQEVQRAASDAPTANKLKKYYVKGHLQKQQHDEREREGEREKQHETERRESATQSQRFIAREPLHLLSSDVPHR